MDPEVTVKTTFSESFKSSSSISIDYSDSDDSDSDEKSELVSSCIIQCPCTQAACMTNVNLIDKHHM